MNPAFRIWLWAQLVCILGSIILTVTSGGSSFIAFIYLIVAVASLVSLLGFFLLLELLHVLQLTLLAGWVILILGVPIIVFFNSLCLFSFLDGGFHWAGNRFWHEMQELLAFTAIPLLGALIGLGLSYRRVSHYITSAVPTKEDLLAQPASE